MEERVYWGQRWGGEETHGNNLQICGDIISTYAEKNSANMHDPEKHGNAATAILRKTSPDILVPPQPLMDYRS